MDVYLFQPEIFNLYYNCSVKSEVEWTKIGVKRPILGCVNIVLGWVVLGLFIPCMKTMLEKQLWQNSCYKLMFLNSVIDFMGVISSSFVTSVLAIQGAVFCRYPTFIYIYGSIGISLWFSQCVAVVSLALNRLADFTQVTSFKLLFEKNYLFIWLILTVASFTFSLFYTRPPLYSSIANMWNANPYFGIDNIISEKSFYISLQLDINNGVTIITLTVCYTILIVAIWLRNKEANGVSFGHVQRKVTIQAFLICLFIYLCAVFYMVFENFPNLFPRWVLFVSFIGWQWSFCGTVVVYMTMNRQLRQGVIKFYMSILGLRKHNVSSVNATTLVT